MMTGTLGINSISTMNGAPNSAIGSQNNNQQQVIIEQLTARVKHEEAKFKKLQEQMEQHQTAAQELLSQINMLDK